MATYCNHYLHFLMENSKIRRGGDTAPYVCLIVSQFLFDTNYVPVWPTS
jgi:hypothetical protein